jgi:hypothetical protein
MELRLSLERLKVSEKRVKRKKRIFFTDKNENECLTGENIWRRLVMRLRVVGDREVNF